MEAIVHARIPAELDRAIDREVEAAREAGLEATRSQVIRRALVAGLQALERARQARTQPQPGLALTWAGAPQ